MIRIHKSGFDETIHNIQWEAREIYEKTSEAFATEGYHRAFRLRDILRHYDKLSEKMAPLLALREVVSTYDDEANGSWEVADPDEPETIPLLEPVTTAVRTIDPDAWK
jgi:hypothetical protein